MTDYKKLYQDTLKTVGELQAKNRELSSLVLNLQSMCYSDSESTLKENDVNHVNTSIKVKSHMRQFDKAYKPTNRGSFCDSKKKKSTYKDLAHILSAKVQISQPQESTKKIYSWVFSQPNPSLLVEVGPISAQSVKEIVAQFPPHAVVKTRAPSKQLICTVKITRYAENGQVTSFYLTLQLNYVMYPEISTLSVFPEMNCYVSQSLPLRKNPRLSTRLLYNQFLSKTFPKTILDMLLISVLLEKSVVVCSSNFLDLSEFVFLLTHFAKGIQIVHTVCYTLYEEQLLNLPVPYIFGTPMRSLLSGYRNYQYTIFVDLDQIRIHHLQQQLGSLRNLNLQDCGQAVTKIVNLSKGSDLDQYIQSLTPDLRLFASQFTETMCYRNI